VVAIIVVLLHLFFQCHTIADSHHGSGLCAAPSPRKQELRRSLNRLRVRLHRTNVKLSAASIAKPGLSKDELLTEIGKYVNGPSYSFIAAQLKLNGVSARGRRWDDESKLLALSL